MPEEIRFSRHTPHSRESIWLYRESESTTAREEVGGEAASPIAGRRAVQGTGCRPPSSAGAGLGRCYQFEGGRCVRRQAATRVREGAMPPCSCWEALATPLNLALEAGERRRMSAAAVPGGVAGHRRPRRAGGRAVALGG